MIIPSIDLMDGKAVQLRQGKEKVLERKDVVELAKEFRKYGDIAVIDLDAAWGKGNNMKLVEELCSIADCRVGGGIRTVEKANGLLQAGAKKIIIGTKANPQFLRGLPKDKVIVAVDTKGGFVVNKGWTSKTRLTPQEMIPDLEPYCSGFLFTDVDREGLMEGIDVKKISALQGLTKNKLTIAGSITSSPEIKWLEDRGFDAQLGMALYTGKINLPDAFANVLDFEKNNGLIPTITQDDQGRVLMLAFSSKESLARTFKGGKAAYFSRSRKKIWKKGETSGSEQDIVKVRYDCDRDTLLFTVKQKNVACHEGKYSCFGDKEFSLADLYQVLQERMKAPAKGSYTRLLLKNPKELSKKIAEECDEVVHFTDRKNLVWELADINYFLLVLMARENITPKEVLNELSRRRK
ncbi:bifunctional phosphoribosyl-AMP cyclohydrolase/phosphoribosyl-ATP diphosphatase HisIE [Candidatus Woesearchaeota archaeon]|nr:bifunctional phosphoribosyl-AMP cyclohydrolase/phosphoribosyl-ATP diphosphatase HisIE [Candidatus Woesearchaeota archaeon]